MEFIKEIIRRLIPYSIRKRWYYKHKLGGIRHEHDMEKVIRRVSDNNRISVLFIASSLPMWRYQDVFEILSKDKRFTLNIIIAPFRRFKHEEASRFSHDLKTYFSSKGLTVPATTDFDFNIDSWLDKVNPDLIFYCQQYTECYGNALDYERNSHRLQGFIPYGLITIQENFVYNAVFHNLAWRVYHPTSLHLTTAKRIMANDARNVRIVGEPHSDRYLGSRETNPWREINDGKNRKRVIWAPHFSINEKGFLHHDSFLWMYDHMIELAKKYSDKIQLAFKPHPLLYSTLCSREDWGKNKTDSYYELWRTMPNTQVETGEFTELFMQSDGLIHDCGSFTGEYMFTRKPVMFMSRNFDEIRGQADLFGKMCLDLHEVGESIEDAKRFIEEIIIGGNDTKSEEREKFFNKHLLPPNGKTVAQNVYDDLVVSLGLH